jgi:hypothetical protein
MGIHRGRLVLDVSDLVESDKTGAYIIGAGGAVATTTNFGAIEALDVNIAGSTGQGIYAEDSAHVSGDFGQLGLVVRKDTQGSLVSADGDYSPLQVDSSGRLRTITDLDFIGDLVADDAVDSESPLKVGSRAVFGALPAISASGDKANMISDKYRRLYVNDSPSNAVKDTAVTVGLTEVALPTTALVGRKRMMVQNKGTKSIFVGATGLTTATGTEIIKDSTMDIPIGESVALFAISGTAGQDVRIFELA